MKIDIRSTYNKITNWNSPIVKPTVVTYAIIILILIFYILFLASKGLAFKINNPASRLFLIIPADFGPVSLLPSSFIVINPLELILNIYIVRLLGKKLEDVLGYFQFILLYLTGSALLISLIFLFTPSSKDYFTAGAGPVALLLGIYTAFYPKDTFFFGSYRSSFPEGLYYIKKLELWILIFCWFAVQLINFIFINKFIESAVLITSVSAVICLAAGYIFGRLFKERGYIENYNEKYKAELEAKYAERETELAGYFRIMKENNPKYRDVQKEFVEEDGTIVDYIEKFCIRCRHYSPEEGVCSKMNENVLEYPEKYNLCGGKYFVKI